MRQFLCLAAVTGMLLASGSSFADSTNKFRLHLGSEPISLNPLKQKNTSGAFLFSAVHGSLLWYEKGELHPLLGQCRQSSSTKITCSIDPKAQFSNGEAIHAEHFIKTFKHFLNPKSPGLRADLLLGLKNANSVLSGKTPFESLGASAKGNELILELENPDYEFIYNLANPIFSPSFSENVDDDFLSPQSAFSGPYQIKSWQPKLKINLVPNQHFPNPKGFQRPELEFFFVAEETVAMNLYEKKELDFLRRLPTLYIPQFKDRPDYYVIDQLRFDYFGFDASLRTQAEARKTLAQSLNYAELQALFSAKPRPGCSGLPENLLPHPSCVDFIPKKSDLSEKPVYQNLTLSYSKLIGGDVDRSAQWMQSQWRQNLNIQVQLSQMDGKIFIDQWKKAPPTIFYATPTPTRPTCLSVLENFLPSAVENWIHLDSPEINELVRKMRSINDKKQKAKLCQKGMDFLIHGFYLIPTGPEYFSILIRPEWKDWHFNELYQLNLAELHHISAK